MLITILARVTLARHGMHSNAGALEREILEGVTLARHGMHSNAGALERENEKNAGALERESYDGFFVSSQSLKMPWAIS